MNTRLLFLLVFAMTCCCLSDANATSYTWTGTASTNWNSSANWSPASVPGPGDDVTIGPTSNAPTIPGGTFSCKSITITGTLTLTLTGSLTVGSGGITVNSSNYVFTVAGSSTLTVTGPINVNQSSTLTITGNLTTSGTVTMGLTATIGNSGSLSFTSGSSVIFGNSATLANTGTVTATAAAFSWPSTSTNGYMTNSSGATFSATGCTFDSEVSGSNVVFLTNAGTFNASGCTFTIGVTNNGAENTINNTGTFHIFGTTATNSVIKLNAQAAGINNTGGTFTIDGNTTLTSTASYALLNNRSPATFNIGSAALGGCTLTFSNTGNNNTPFYNTGTFSVYATAINFSGGANNQTQQIYNNGTFTMNGGSSLTTSGYAGINNASSGTFYAGTSNSACTLTFTGSASNGLPITNAGLFYVGSTSIINLNGGGTYTAQEVLANTGTFTFQSDGYGTGALGALSNPGSGATTNAQQITGTFTVQRYLTGGAGYRGYRLLSSPVYAGTDSYNNNVYSINYLKSAIYLTGTSTPPSSSGFDNTATANPTLYLYRENLAPLYTTFLNSNFIGISNIFTGTNNPPTYSMNDVAPYATGISIPAGNGFLCFFRGDRSKASFAAETVTSYVPVAATLSASGTLNYGPVTVSDWYTPASNNLNYTTTSGSSSIEGFNLVGNPYPSTIDWNTYSATSSTAGIYAPNVGNTIYVYNPSSKTYATYMSTGAATNGGSRYIPSGQGFFVKAGPGPSPSLTFNEAAKTTTNIQPSTLLLAAKEPQTTDQHLRIKMELDSVNNEDTYIGFNSAASPAYVFNEDAAYKAGSGLVGLCNISADNVQLAINELPFPKQSESIPLNINATANGTYTLNLTEAVNIPKLYDVWLMDAYKKDSVNLKQNPVYSFNLTIADTNSYGSKRFALAIRQNTAYAYKLLNFTGTKITGGSQLAWTTQNEDTFTGFSLQRSTDGGKTYMVLDSLQSTGAGSYSYLDANPAPGVNLYRLLQNGVNGNITYSNVVQLVYPGNGQATANISLYPNPVSSIINLAILNTSNTSASYTINILNSTGVIVKTASAQDTTWQSDTSGLSPGVYILQVINNADKTIVGSSKFIKL